MGLKGSAGAFRQDDTMISQLVSLDLILALPIASVAILLLFGSFYGMRAYLAAAAYEDQEILRLYYVSQVMVNVGGQSARNYASAWDSIREVAHEYGTNATLSELGAARNCPVYDVCRIIMTGSIPSFLEVSR